MVQLVHLDTTLQQQLGYIEVLIENSYVQSVLTVLVGHQDIGVGVEKQPRQTGVPVPSAHVQSRVLVNVSIIHIGAILDQVLGKVKMALSEANVQRREARIVLLVDADLEMMNK